MADESSLDTKINWIPSMKNLGLKDIPSFIRATNTEDIMLNFFVHEADRAKRASAIILNTFDSLEHDVVRSIHSIIPQVYTIGPLHLFVNRDIDEESDIGQIGTNMWREEMECLDWLDTKSPNSVVYVNFGSITVMSAKQLVEFAWGLAATKKDFLWVIRPDLVAGDVPMLPPDFLIETANRRMLASWCPQEKVLSHPAVGGFLTHSGWNSTLESLSGGVPMVCWPFFAEQQTNYKYCCDEWEVGMEIGGDVRREEVEELVRELMDGDKGKKMRQKAEEWQRLAEEATKPIYGSSELNFQMVVDKVLLGE
ncbi:UGT85A5 [Arabidopsis thaliana]|uniref:UGT85A5 n=1 Tax=Arabidopsis thaliana TaxID=3702 RepID=A0A178WM93_ARATH|nr:UGT85A5 [Arabidopsis thaliana]